MPFDIYNPNKNLIHYSCRKTKILLSPEYWLANRIYSVDYRGFFCYKISVSPMSWKEQNMKILYPATFEKDGGYVLVQFPDIPEAMTQGATAQEAHAKAKEVLGLALVGKQDFPEATAVDVLERKYPDKTVTLIEIDF